jgi:transglutaminase-like putative cysteine protease
MRLKIHHETRYSYSKAPDHLVQRLHLQPADYDAQKTVTWTVSAPGIDKAVAYVDGFGNWIHLVTTGGLSGGNTIVAEGEVETTDAAGVVRGLKCVAPDAVFLRQTSVTLPNAAIRQAAARISGTGASLERAHALMDDVHGRIAYEVGTTQTSTTATEAFSAGRGVCQDHAHVMISMARELGIPARYVTGYLVTGVGSSSAAAHAWAELLIPDLGWVGFDAANKQCPTTHYVRVAAGLDAASVAPVRGSRMGNTGDEQMKVEVRVEIAQQ